MLMRVDHHSPARGGINVSKRRRMTPAELRGHMQRLELTQEKLALLLDVTVKTVQRWVHLTEPYEIPRAVEILIPMLTPEQAKELIAEVRFKKRTGRKKASR